jgi:hypothetical protein
MVRWSYAAWLCLFVGGGVAACNKTCVDDGLHGNQDPAVCVAATTTATSTSGTSTTDATTSTTDPTTTSTLGDSDCTCDDTTLGLTSAPDTGATTGTGTSTGADTDVVTTDVDTFIDTTGEPGTCFDEAQNQNETDLDCGGVCVAQGLQCPQGGGCDLDDDCQAPYTCHPMGVCVEPLCNNGFFDPGIEAHVDCGSSCGPLCGLGTPCSDPDDCAPGLGCHGGHCAMNPQCGDGELTIDESDLDCGGPLCGASCRQFQLCKDFTDCISYSCVDGVCEDLLCQDDIQNHGETDIDCGGPCEPCFSQMKCAANSDCFSFECVAFLCA